MGTPARIHIIIRKTNKQRIKYTERENNLKQNAKVIDVEGGYFRSLPPFFLNQKTNVDARVDVTLNDNLENNFDFLPKMNPRDYLKWEEEIMGTS